MLALRVLVARSEALASPIPSPKREGSQSQNAPSGEAWESALHFEHIVTN